MSDAMHPLLAATPLLDVRHPDIETLVGRRGWRTLTAYDRIVAVDEAKSRAQASKILADLDLWR
jgi:hypothetical protein